MRSGIIITVLLLLFIQASGQHLKNNKGHENNPYYSNTDLHKLNVSNTAWKKILSPALYATAREQATETPFTGKYWNKFAKGTYYCAVWKPAVQV